MARIMHFKLKRNEPYRGLNRGLWERKLKSMERRALSGLRNGYGYHLCIIAPQAFLIGARAFYPYSQKTFIQPPLQRTQRISIEDSGLHRLKYKCMWRDLLGE